MTKIFEEIRNSHKGDLTRNPLNLRESQLSSQRENHSLAFPVDEDPSLRCPRIHEGQEIGAASIMWAHAQDLSARSGLSLINGALASPENHQPHWALHTAHLPHFTDSIMKMKDRVDFLFFEELLLDENLLHQLSREVGLLAQEESPLLGNSRDIGRILHALRSRRGNLVSVTLYGFLRDGKMIFCRWETMLASFVQFPEKLLEPESLHWVRRLRNSDELPQGLN